MIKTVQITNYRCFKEVTINDLTDVNVVVGENGSGKTTLLESVFWPGCNPQWVLFLRNWRNLAPMQLIPTKLGYESIWKDLFHQFSQNRIIELSLQGSPENTRSLKIYYKAPESVPLLPVESRDSSVPIPIVFDTKDSNGTLHSQSVSIAGGMFQVQGPQPQIAVISFFGVGQPGGTHSGTAIQYSDLSKQNREGAIIEALRTVFPQIKRLSIETSGGTPEIYCSVDGLSEKIPVGLVSHGISKLLAILINIATVPKGACLIDEIENGFHYSVLPKMWEAILTLSKQQEVQLFVSTHSEECLRALKPFVAQNEHEFRLLRVEEGNAGGHTVAAFKGKNFDAALQSGIEFR
jgi:ABC-type branched-subunit amino acid transport system ATPase component